MSDLDKYNSNKAEEENFSPNWTLIDALNNVRHTLDERFHYAANIKLIKDQLEIERKKYEAFLKDSSEKLQQLTDATRKNEIRLFLCKNKLKQVLHEDLLEEMANEEQPEVGRV